MWGLVIAAVLTAACADDAPGVVRGTATALPNEELGDETGSSTTDGAPNTTTNGTDTTDPDTTDPDTTDPDTTGSVDGLGLDDPFFPALGAPGIDVLAYDVHLSFDPGDPELTGSATLTLAPLGPAAVLSLDAGEAIEVTGVTVDRAPASFTHQDGELVISPERPPGVDRDVVLEVAWRLATRTGPVAADWTSTGWTSTPDGAVVLDEPDGLHRWMPANDHPSDKAQWDLTIDVPDGTTAVSNGVLVASQTAAGRTSWHWHTAEPMASYLVLVMIGDYEIVEDITSDGLPLLHAVAPDLLDETRPIMEATGAMIDQLEPWFGPFPFSTYGIAVSEQVLGVAMEYQTRSLFGPDTLDPGIAVHELAHQWFGDAVTPERWPDIWLNESFATYAEWLYRESTDEDIDAVANAALRAGRTEAPGDISVDSMFSADVYSGGAIVLHALRRELGDEDFRTVLHRWVAENSGLSVTTDDFIALAESVAGRSLSEFFRDWLFTAWPPDSFPE